MRKLSLVALAALITVGTLFGASYKVDAGHSSIDFKVRHMMVSYTKGTFDEFNGNFEYNPQTKHLSKLFGNVNTSSVNTKDDKRDEHLRSADFFNVKKYPKMQLELIKHSGDSAIFNLTIKGITKKVEFKVAELSALVKDPWGYKKSGFTLSATINRKDFNLNFNKVLDNGGLAVGDDVKMLLELEGIAI